MKISKCRMCHSDQDIVWFHVIKAAIVLNLGHCKRCDTVIEEVCDGYEPFAKS